MANKEGLDKKISWKKTKIWKPNLIQLILIKLKIIKDPRFNGKKLNHYLLDEAGHWSRENKFKEHWNLIKKVK